MKIYFYISLLLLVVACSKENETGEVENPAPVAPPCTINWVKPSEGYYKIRRRWPELDSTLHHVTWIYDTVLQDCHLLYRDCNMLYYQERKLSFKFDTTLQSTINLSTNPEWTDFITLQIDTVTDSIFIQEEYGHLGRVYVLYSGYKE